VWKANLKNVALLEQHTADPAAARHRDRLFVSVLVGGVVVVCMGLLAGGVFLAAWLIRVLAGS
jgi:hypothetical protein